MLNQRYLKYICHVCLKSFAEARTLRAHLQREYNLELPSVPEGRKSAKNNQFVHMNDFSSTSQEVVSYFACPSCSNYFETLDELKSHVEQHSTNQKRQLEQYQTSIPKTRRLETNAMPSASSAQQPNVSNAVEALFQEDTATCQKSISTQS
ncbi:hypothetical protein DM01DRAFT_97295 [Hesseltinella vesiculosa]|uniref:C2H2-type domain-containing protein n=1 Tax=Hesseltinella vesiculosa TaxID=101127 RepID=A0A1X2GNJ3_9FUNG|nr:hypothetical protein DM01DRAFT_97295 [Hesseltinella vesiculosa]